MLKLIYIHNPQWILKDSKRLDMYIIDDIIIKFFFYKNILENQSHIKICKDCPVDFTQNERGSPCNFFVWD